MPRILKPFPALVQCSFLERTIKAYLVANSHLMCLAVARLEKLKKKLSGTFKKRFSFILRACGKTAMRSRSRAVTPHTSTSPPNNARRLAKQSEKRGSLSQILKEADLSGASVALIGLRNRLSRRATYLWLPRMPKPESCLIQVAYLRLRARRFQVRAAGTIRDERQGLDAISGNRINFQRHAV